MFSFTHRPAGRSLTALTVGAALSISLSLSVLVAPVSATTHDTSQKTDVAPASDAGLFGSADPTFDGVFRQSFAILGLDATGSRVPRAAVDWLIDQQCPDGSFVSYRADTSAACPEPDPQAFTGPDTNSTAMAAMALAAMGATSEADAAIAWLLAGQTRSGGWSYLPGGSPDTNSTGLALAAIDALNPPGHQRSVRIATNFMRRAQVPCETEQDVRFGMPYQAGLNPDTFSSSQSLLGLSGAFPVREVSQRRAVPKVDCRDDQRVVDPGAGVARWVSRLLNTNDGGLPNTFDPTAVDWNSTALSILGMVALRSSGNATQKALQALTTNIEAYIGSSAGDRPAALGISLLVATATGSNPRDFGGADLTARLLATRQR